MSPFTSAHSTGIGNGKTVLEIHTARTLGRRLKGDPYLVMLVGALPAPSSAYCDIDVDIGCDRDMPPRAVALRVRMCGFSPAGRAASGAGGADVPAPGGN